MKAETEWRRWGKKVRKRIADRKTDRSDEMKT